MNLPLYLLEVIEISQSTVVDLLAQDFDVERESSDYSKLIQRFYIDFEFSGLQNGDIILGEDVNPVVFDCHEEEIAQTPTRRTEIADSRHCMRKLNEPGDGNPVVLE